MTENKDTPDTNENSENKSCMATVAKDTTIPKLESPQTKLSSIVQSLLYPPIKDEKIWGLGKKGIWTTGLFSLFLLLNISGIGEVDSSGTASFSLITALPLYTTSGYFMLQLARLYRKNIVFWGYFGLLMPIVAQIAFSFYMNKTEADIVAKKERKKEIKAIRDHASQQGTCFTVCKYRSGLPYFNNNSNLDIIPGRGGIYFFPSWGNKQYFHMPWNRFVRCDSITSMDSGDQAVITGTMAQGRGGSRYGMGAVVGGMLATEIVKKHELRIFYKKGEEGSETILEVIFEVSNNEKIKNMIMRYAAES